MKREAAIKWFRPITRHDDYLTDKYYSGRSHVTLTGSEVEFIHQKKKQQYENQYILR